MLTFNIQAPNTNYYRGHRPSNKSSNCWICDKEDALNVSIEQARVLLEIKWISNCNVVISLSSTPISDEECEQELFCLNGGRWYEYKEEV